MKIRNHFVVGFVYRSQFYERQLTKFNAILPAGLLFFTFWPLSRKRKEKSTLRSRRLERSGR
jgi:hypothetical protein